MAKYDAKCEKCEIVFEYEAPMCNSGDPPPPCPECHHDKTTKQFALNGGGFILNGQGWFKKGGY